MKILSFHEYFRHGLSLNQYSTFNSQCLISVIHILSLVIVLQYTCIHLSCVGIACICFFRNIQSIARIFIGFRQNFSFC